MNEDCRLDGCAWVEYRPVLKPAKTREIAYDT